MPKEKIDICSAHKNDYVAPHQPALVKIEPGSYLTIEGEGAPGTETFTTRIGALYGVAFTVKMTRKFEGRQDYTIGKLEAQWWCDGAQEFAGAPKQNWRWKLLIRTPEFVTQKEIDDAVATLRKRGKGGETEHVRLERLSEGNCVQMLHIGPYEKESSTIASMKAFAASKELTLRGRHHEIYISDPRRVAPERLKTILRIPVA